MREKELSVCIWIHHIATLLGIAEGICYLFAGKQGFWRKCAVFSLTLFQLFAGFKILTDLRRGRSRLADSYENLKKMRYHRGQERGILYTIVLSSAIFKVLPVYLFRHGR